jgi:hypothetical protein
MAGLNAQVIKQSNTILINMRLLKARGNHVND